MRRSRLFNAGDKKNDNDFIEQVLEMTPGRIRGVIIMKKMVVGSPPSIASARARK